LDAETQLASAKTCLNPLGTPSSDSCTKSKIEQDADFSMKEKTDSKPPLVLPGANGNSSLSGKGGPVKKTPESRTPPPAPRTEPSAMNKMKVVKTESGSSVEKSHVRKRAGIQNVFLHLHLWSMVNNE
jgi:hypothetical protein